MKKYTTTSYTTRTSVNPKRGGIINDRVINETPLTVKVLSINLPNGTDEQHASSLWATRLPENYKFQRHCDAKLEECIGIIYGNSNIHTYSKNVSL